MSYIAFRQRDPEKVSAVVPAIGVIGPIVFFPLRFWHLYTDQLGMFSAGVLLTITVIALEVLYFERESIEDEVTPLENTYEFITNLPGLEMREDHDSG